MHDTYSWNIKTINSILLGRRRATITTIPVGGREAAGWLSVLLSFKPGGGREEGRKGLLNSYVVGLVCIRYIETDFSPL